MEIRDLTKKMVLSIQTWKLFLYIFKYCIYYFIENIDYLGKAHKHTPLRYQNII